jgi:hypothetical protein
LAPQANEFVQPAATSALGDWVSIEHLQEVSLQVAVTVASAAGALVQVDVSNDFATGNTTGKFPTIPSSIVNFDTIPNVTLTLGNVGAQFLQVIAPGGGVNPPTITAKWARIRYTAPVAGSGGTITARWEGSGPP